VAVYAEEVDVTTTPRLGAAVAARPPCGEFSQGWLLDADQARISPYHGLQPVLVRSVDRGRSSEPRPGPRCHPTLPPLRPHRLRPVPGGGSRRWWLTRRGSRPCEMPYNVPGCMNVGGATDSAGCSYGATDGPTGLIRSEMSEKSSWGMVKSPRRNGSPQWLGSLTKES
jgi:hypothetical protein